MERPRNWGICRLIGMANAAVAEIWAAWSLLLPALPSLAWRMKLSQTGKEPNCWLSQAQCWRILLLFPTRQRCLPCKSLRRWNKMIWAMRMGGGLVLVLPGDGDPVEYPRVFV